MSTKLGIKKRLASNTYVECPKDECKQEITGLHRLTPYNPTRKKVDEYLSACGIKTGVELVVFKSSLFAELSTTNSLEEPTANKASRQDDVQKSISEKQPNSDHTVVAHTDSSNSICNIVDAEPSNNNNMTMTASTHVPDVHLSGTAGFLQPQSTFKAAPPIGMFAQHPHQHQHFTQPQAIAANAASNFYTQPPPPQAQSSIVPSIYNPPHPHPHHHQLVHRFLFIILPLFKFIAHLSLLFCSSFFDHSVRLSNAVA